MRKSSLLLVICAFLLFYASAVRAFDRIAAAQTIYSIGTKTTLTIFTASGINSYILLSKGSGILVSPDGDLLTVNHAVNPFNLVGLLA